MLGFSFTVNRLELKRMLTFLGVGGKSIDELISTLNKAHRHVNVITFAGMLEKLGLSQDSVVNILRRIGIDDIAIENIFSMLDEERIKSSYGRLVEVSVE